MNDLSGHILGRLTAIKPIIKTTKRNWKWLTLCSCGNEIITPGASLTNGHTKSCGCLKKETAARVSRKFTATHGKSGTRLYRIWEAMRRRCNSKSCEDYKWYGNKGVMVCSEWNEFTSFHEWAISHGYEENLTIDRIDSDLGYSPNNCQWVTNEDNVKRARYEKIHGKASADKIEILQVFEVATGEDVTDQYRGPKSK